MVKIKLNTIQDVDDFIAITTKMAGDVCARQGRYVVSAKSIMGLFALSHLIPFDLESDDYDDQTLRVLFSNFVYNEEK
jgi:hypothetical protein